MTLSRGIPYIEPLIILKTKNPAEFKMKFCDKSFILFFYYPLDNN